MTEDVAVHSIALVLENGHHLPDLLRHAFTHPWVSTYQVGFGPPLVRASDKLVDRLRGVQSTFDKLRIYLECCILDGDECKRLAEIHSKSLTRRLGQLEAEDVDRYSADALDLSLRLYDIHRAPPQVVESMRGAHLDTKWPKEVGFEQLGARFLVRLSDPRNERLLELPELRSALGNRPVEAVDPKKSNGAEGHAEPADPKKPPPLPSKRKSSNESRPIIGALEFALDLRAPVGADEVFAAWAESIAATSPVKVVSVPLERLPSRVRVRRNGEHL
ncbi:MAG: hypothetical protein HY791_04500 [Deltaproteobacteria bacterium]|nr:hypothetical protein [Deltaproteobacteria bacterium]